MKRDMRLLAIETSARRGSVALLDAGNVVARATHHELNAHAERLRPLLDSVLAEAGWGKSELERVGVGMGPGSFTGVRVGVAFAHGIALGLGIPVLGVASLAAMARAAPPSLAGLRVALLDARRGEVFVAAYAADGSERVPAFAVARGQAVAEIARRAGTDFTALGELAAELGLAQGFRSELTDLPDAVGVGLLAGELPLDASLVEPLYVRDAGATPQHLPRSPLA